MAWVYDASNHQYRDGDLVVTERQMLDLRNAIADGMSEESEALAKQLVAKTITLAKWAKAFAQLIADGIGAGFLLGRGGTALMDDASVSVLDGLIADQLGYAKAFATDLATALLDDKATEDGVAGRSALYAGASVHAFDQGRSQDWGVQLPYYPADGETECGGNCRCEWQLVDTDTELTATWITVGDRKVCDDCQARGDEYGPGSPFVQSKGAA
jgi:hypothetical protein